MTALTICEKIIQASQIRPKKTAMVLIDHNGKNSICYQDMLEQIRNIAYQLQCHGITRGDRVAIISENHPNWIIAYLATLFIGATAVPLDPASTIETLTTFINNSAAKLAFVSPTLQDKFSSVCQHIPYHLVTISLFRSPKSTKLSQFEEWTHLSAPTEYRINLSNIKPDDIAVMVYTSGTTGQPKAVPLTHSNIFAEADGVVRAMNFNESEVVLGLLPLFHVYSQVVSLWIVPMIGATVVFISELTSSEIARGLKEGGITALVGVPRLWYLFHKKIFDQVNAQSRYKQWLFKAMLTVNGWLRDWCGINIGKFCFSRVHQFFGNRLRLAISAGARFDPDIARDFHSLGFTILQGYGLTETSGAISFNRFKDNLVGSVGKPLEGVAVKINAPDTEGIGEVLVRGPIVMSGYYNNPSANQTAFNDGWFCTGDLGKFDQKGNLYILGRSKEVFKLPSGKNIFPDDIEAHYSHSPMVSEICLLGVPDRSSPFQGAEKLCAVVVPDFNYLKDHHIANTREAIRFELDTLGHDLPEYQRAHDYILRTQSLPRTTTNKVRRNELRKELESNTGIDQQRRKTINWEFTASDLSMIDSPTGQAVTTAIRQQLKDAQMIHPQMNLELDLSLDSLARAECIASIEHILNIALPPNEVIHALTVGELVSLINSKLANAQTVSSGPDRPYPTSSVQINQQNWHELLTETSGEITDINGLTQKKTILAGLVFLLLKLIYLMAKILLRVEVSGLENLTKVSKPFLICPNHQSYLDAILICSTYPYRILSNIFHVGASIYFTGRFSGWFARLLNIVPIDADSRLLSAMQAGAAGLRAGKILNVYPEGERSFDGKLGEFKKGPAILATELNLPIIPVVIDGSYRVLPRNSNRISLAKVKIRFGAPIIANQIAPEITDSELRYVTVTGVLKGEIQKMINDMRA